MNSDRLAQTSITDISRYFPDILSGIVCQISIIGTPERNYLTVYYNNQALAHSHLTRFPYQPYKVSSEKLAAMLYSLTEDSGLVIFFGIDELLRLPHGNELFVHLLKLLTEDDIPLLLLKQNIE